MSSTKASILLAQSAARTATTTLEVEGNDLGSGVFIVDVTAGASGTDTLTVTIDGYDKASGKWYNLLTAAAITTNSTNVYRVGDKTPAAANLTAQDFLPHKFRVVVTHATGASVTYSVGANLSD